MRVHLTRAATFGPICQYLEAGGVSVSRRLSDIGISPEFLRVPEAMVPLEHCARFVDRTVTRDGIENLGLEAGSRCSIGDFGAFGMVLRQSLTLKDLLEKLIAWMPLVDTGAKVWLDPVEESDAVRFCIEHEIGQGKAHANDYGLMLLIDAVRMVAGPGWCPSEIWLNRQRGGERLGRFEAFSEAIVRYHSQFVGFLIPRLLLSKRVRRESRPAVPMPNPERSLETSAPPDDLIGSVTCAIRAGMKSRAPSLDEVADLAGCNRRSVQRSLSANGTSFRELLDRVRFEEATTCLLDGKIHVSEIAYHLGYTELSNFTHAFVRWTGISPSVYRERLVGAEIGA